MENIDVKVERSNEELEESNQRLNAYYSEIRDIPVLSKIEVYDLFKAYKEHGDLKARDKIIESHQKFVVYVAKRYTNDESLLVELINNGNKGLNNAIDNFDVNHAVSINYKFSTYADPYIKREIKCFLNLNDPPNPIGGEDNEYLTILLPEERKIVESFYGIGGESPCSPNSIAEKHECDPENIRQILQKSIEKLRTRSKISKIVDDVEKYINSSSSNLETFLLDLHLNKKYTPADISKNTVFTDESIQASLLNSIDSLYQLSIYKKIAS